MPSLHTSFGALRKCIFVCTVAVFAIHSRDQSVAAMLDSSHITPNTVHPAERYAVLCTTAAQRVHCTTQAQRECSNLRSPSKALYSQCINAYYDECIKSCLH
jgi:hypothetical protein